MKNLKAWLLILPTVLSACNAQNLEIESQNLIGCGLLTVSTDSPVKIFANANDWSAYDEIVFNKITSGEQEGITAIKTERLKGKLKPYALYTGASLKENERFINSGLGPIYPILEFKVLDSTTEYFRVLLNEDTNEVGYIKKDGRGKIYSTEIPTSTATQPGLPYFSFTSWEYYLKNAQYINVSDIAIYDGIDGAVINEKFRHQPLRFKVIAVNRQWAKIQANKNIFDDLTNPYIYEGWIKWNDGQHILVAIIWRTIE